MHRDTLDSTNDVTPGSSEERLLWNRPATKTRRGFLEWWYSLAAPEEPLNATSHDREQVRAGQLSSIILLITLCFGLSQLPNALVSTSYTFLFILLTAMTVNVGMFMLNRQGMVTTVGIVMVVVVEVAFMLYVVSRPALSARSLTAFDLIVLTELIAVSLLPPRSVFPVTLCNTLFTWAAITFLPHAPDLRLTTASAYYSALASPLMLQIIVALVTYLWARGARRAIERAERLAALERVLAERDRIEAEQKQQLELGIQQILQTLIQTANGNFDARAPLTKEHKLWQVAYALNTSLARLQRGVQSEGDLQRTKTEMMRMIEALRSAKVKQRPFVLQRTGSMLDPLAQELIGNYIHQP